MIRPGTALWLILVIAVGYAMFQVKYEVMQQEETLGRLSKDIAETREQIRVIDAEWSYLTRPDRLKRLAARYLNLAPIAAAQIGDLASVPERANAPAALVSEPNPSFPAQPRASEAMAAQATAAKYAAADKGVLP